ncbi:exocyst complex component [Ophiostoma piceae UAMH 11346]|uniref:Exocyst complex component n=1 Tax=Ophiostoma piceae (strain UAMH 11346) TaxID=1262450 RepID=S3C879_OPHP1|nr:exocyst complex component [Ophiostoma piceae UAMH 11346]
MASTGGREMGRAERFEDEKRRIIDSCFNRRDDDGSIVETYITHIKILEFSSHPTSPPPPQSRSPQSEKNRVIIVAVRKSGRVRVHKSKENANGTFSIGKTWDLNDLTAIESYTAASVSPDFRAWAGNVGFLITLGKPYYWQAQTDKEKKFFIASLLKIYGKYSGGRVPTLTGFDPYEIDQIQGGAQRRAPPPTAQASAPAQASALAQPPPQQLPPPQTAPSTISAQSSFSQLSQPQSQSQPAPPPAREAVPIPSSASNKSYGGPGGPGSAPGSMGSADFRNQRSAMLANGTASPATSIDSSRSATQTAMRRLAANNKSQESVAASVAASMTGRSDDGNSLPPRSRNGPINNSGQLNGGLADSPAITEGKPPPERKRPPMDPSRPQGTSDENLVPAPLMSMARSRDGPVGPGQSGSATGMPSATGSNNVVPPPRSSNRSSPFNDTSRANDMVPSPLRSPSNGAYPAAPTVPPSQTLPRPPPQSRSISDFAKIVSAAAAATAASAVSAVTTTPITESPTSITPTSTTPGQPTEGGARGSESPASPDDPDDSRPGLGPMIKKKSKGDIANVFWKAATAASVFKPRPGGAGERLRLAANKYNDEPDGITGVVPAPPRPVSPKPDLAAEAAASEERPKTPQRSSVRSIPEVKVTVPNSSRPSSLQKPKPISKDPVDDKPPPVPPKPKTGMAIDTRKSVMSGNDTKYLAALGVDSTIMDKHSVEFAKWLDYFGWVPGDAMRKINTEDLKIDLDRELNRAQAGGWLSRFQDEDDRVESIKKGIDTAIDECEELDNLLTLYSVELSTLSDDIAYIEAQGQGLQVQAANQKLLKKELESLLDTCAITSNDLEALRTAPLESAAGIEEIETALVTLYKAMSKINPSLGGGSDGAASALAQLEAAANGTSAADQPTTLNTDFGQMRVVREKKEMYLAESDTFMRRLVIFMATEFDQAWALTRKAMDSALAKKVDPRNHEVGRDLLWKYSPLILYAREADQPNWNRIIQIYEDKSHPVYKSQFRELLMAWKKNARKPNADDSEILFTSLQEKKEESITTTARKLTVKRSQTLARSLRSPLGDGSSRHSEKNSHAGANDSRSHPYEVFASVLEELLPLVQMEQNFIIDLFHATTLQQTDFADAVAACRPVDRHGTSDLRRHRPMEPDRELARRVTRAMEAVFSFMEVDLQNLIDWVLSLEALQGIGVMATLERRMADLMQSNQEFLNNTLQKLHGTLEGRFRKFVDEQVRAIEETKVKIKKRKGVIGFMRIFPNFSAAVENMLADVAVDDPNSSSPGHSVTPSFGVRRTVDGEYDRILRSMFESLKVIARENPTMTAASAGSADPEDKEALNFHILLIENMNHYIEEVDNSRGIRVLAVWKDEASAELREHMGLYLNAVMRRPLGRLLEHLENVEAQLASGKAPAAVAAQPSNSKNTFNKVLGSHDGKEVRKGIETLRKRVEKHFSGSNEEDGDEKGDKKLAIPLPTVVQSPNSPSKSHLVAMVLAEAERFYGEVEMRINTIVTNVYGGDVMYEWPRADVKQAFAAR